MDLRTRQGFARARWRELWWRCRPAHFLLHANAGARELGRAGEQLAARRLVREGYRLLARRLVTRAAEVDLLAERDGRLWLVEVKTGRAARPRRPHGRPLWDPRAAPGRRLGAEQRRRLTAAARLLLAASARHQVAGLLLVEVLVDPRAQALECRIRPEAGLEVHRRPPRGRSS